MYRELEAVFKAIRDADLIRELKTLRNHRGRRGYHPRPLLRSYIASFVFNLPSTNHLFRRLEDDPLLCELCGFNEGKLPTRRTFNNFIERLSHYPALIEACLNRLTNRLKRKLKGFGKEVAIDSTTVRTHSRYRKEGCSDPEATWGVGHNAQSRDRESRQWKFGYKVHMVSDANYGIPLAQIVTTGSRNDSPVLPTLVDKALTTFNWFKPKLLTGDRGYDSAANHQYLIKKGIIPVIHIRRASNSTGLYQGIYTEQGVPTCMGMVPMEYVGTTAKGHHLYRCKKMGCHLKTSRRGGIRHCDTVYLQDPSEDWRLFGVIRRDSPLWRKKYGKRWAIERVFKSLKESRRLERHCVRGIRRIKLHALMSAITFQATALVKALAGRVKEIRWMVRAVA